VFQGGVAAAAQTRLRPWEKQKKIYRPASDIDINATPLSPEMSLVSD